MTKKPRIASVDDPTILAAVRGYFRWEHDWQAREMLTKIHDNYLRSKEQDDCTGMEFPTLRLWVSGFGVTKEEKAEGYRGHFVRLTIQAAEAGKWTIAAEKLPVALDKHPQKERPKAPHPNWGHPVLRAVETAKIFPGLEIARAQLQALHIEYPDATIPGKDVLHVMVYNRKLSAGDDDSPIEKITLKVKPQSDGGAKLMLKPKTKKKKKVARTVEPTETKGKFTAMVKRKRAKK